MLLVVADTGPLLYSVQIDEIDLPPQPFEKIFPNDDPAFQGLDGGEQSALALGLLTDGAEYDRGIAGLKSTCA